VKLFSEPGVLVDARSIVGVLLVVLSATCFGTNPIFARLSFEAGTDPITYLFLRFIIASPAMLVIMYLKGYKVPRGRQLAGLALLSVIGAGTTFCFYTAIYYAPVNLIIVITFMYPTFVVLLSAVFLKQAITLFKVAALILTILGIYFAVGWDYGGYGLGILLGIGAALCHSFYLMLGSRFIQKAGPFQTTTLIMIFSAFIYGIYAGFQGPHLPMTLYGWSATAASALFSTALGSVTFFAGLKRINTSNAAIISTFEVVVTAALAVVILGEVLSGQKIFGACLVISAVVILAKSE
jgi:drug/metabolite transporter (DMT)-like permease